MPRKRGDKSGPHASQHEKTQDEVDRTEEFISAVDLMRRHLDEDEFDNALPFCNKAFQIRPDCVEIRRYRIFTLLNLAKWTEAYSVCEKHPGPPQDVAFERAYCLYRMNRSQEALEALQTANVDEMDRLRLDAQIHYRMGDYKECAQIYEDLFARDEEVVELLVNAVGCHVSAGQTTKAIALVTKHEHLLTSCYELLFNLACAHIDRGEFIEADDRLTTAKNLCMSELMLAENIAEEDAAILEDHAELATIKVQQACVLQRRGMWEEAKETYSQVLRHRVGEPSKVDVTVLAVACNNLVVLNPSGQSLVDSLKRINLASRDAMEHQLTRKQKVEIAANKCLLLLQADQIDEAKKEAQRVRQVDPGSARLIITLAAIGAAEKKSKVSESLLQNFLSENPDNEDVLLALAQLRVKNSKQERAIQTLTQLPVHLRVEPRVVEAMATLYHQQKENGKAVECLREAVEFWRKKKNAEASFAAVLRTASRLAMELKDALFAAEILQLYLEEVDGTDVEALCGIVQALASTDVDRAEEFVQRLQLPPLDDFDPEELEKAAIPKIPKTAILSKNIAPGEDATAEENNLKRKKKKRKPRYPKGFDPENPGPPPDPERWLPKRERTAYKEAMRKKTTKHSNRGPQGAMPTDDNMVRKQGPSTAHVEAAKDITRRSTKSKKEKK